MPKLSPPLAKTPTRLIPSIVKTPTWRLTVREGTIEDYREVAALQIRNNFTPLSPQEWAALWQGNPVCKSWGGQTPIGWALESSNREIAGWLGNLLSEFQFRGRILRAATPWSWLVDASHRGHGMMLLNRFLRQEGIDLFVCTSVSPVSERFTRRVGFSRVPRGNWAKSAFWVADFRAFTQFVLETRRVAASSVLARPLSTALSCWDFLHQSIIRRSRPTATVEVCAGFDTRFDHFWEQLCRENENVLLGVRDRDTLSWRFQMPRIRGNFTILTFPSGSRLAAYAIFDRRDNPATGLRRVRFVDFQALRGWEVSVWAALDWILRRSREEEIHILEMNGCWLDRDGWPKISAPFHRDLDSWLYYYRANDAALAGTLKNPQAWAPSLFDGDASL